MKRFSKSISVVISTLLSLAIWTFAGPAQAEPGWDYSQYRSHGMSHCAFGATGPAGQTVNVGTMSEPPGNTVEVTGQAGLWVNLRLICERSQNFDTSGELASAGPEGNYSGPGTPRVIGTDTPGQSGAPGYQGQWPKGREWTVMVGNTTTTHPLSWTGELGSDTITVKLVPVVPPVSQPQLTAVVTPLQQQYSDTSQKADQAYEMASRRGDWRDRVVSLGLTYQLGMDSLTRDADARQGGAFDLGVHLGDLGGDDNVKFLTGGVFSFSHDQKKIVAVPNQPVNGFNAWTEWYRVFMGPKAGIDWMPASFFSLQAYGSLGLMLSIDGTIPESQLPDKTLYSGESDTVAAFAYRAALQPTFVIADHFTVFASTSLEGNITELPTERGPEKVCDGATNDCFVRRDGHFLDWSLGGGIGAMW